MGLHIDIEVNAIGFLEKNEEILLRDESQNNLILGIASNMAQGKQPTEDPIMATVFDDKSIVGQALRTSPERPLILGSLTRDAVISLSHELKVKNIMLSGVVGPVELAKAFASDWSKENIIGMHQGIYEIREVIHPQYEGEEMILATEEEFNIVEKYCVGFIKDCFPNENRESEGREAARVNIENKTLYLLRNEKGEIVSMAANNRRSRNGATVGWVYTPEEYRKNGYASKIVAMLSDKLLKDGNKFCNLFTDLLNPTSNLIYQKVGYKKIGESMYFSFK